MRIAVCDDNKNWLDQASAIIHMFAEENGLQPVLFLFSDTDVLLQEQKEPFDLIFMDIVLGREKNGIQIVKMINERWPACQIVYLTNYLGYAMDVYETEHVWFVLKSQFKDRLPVVFERVKHRLEHGLNLFVFTASDQEIVTLDCGKIRYLERSGRLTSIVTEDRVYYTRDKIAPLLERLPAGDFLRCHSSYIVYLPAVQSIQKDRLLMKDGSVIIISRSYQKEFRRSFLEWAASRRQL